MRTSAKKRHTNNLWNDSRWFCLQCLKTFCYFLRRNQENICLENYIRVWAFKYRPVPIDQVLCTCRMLCLLQYWQFQLTALPRQTMQRAQNTVKVDSHVFFQTRTHLH